MATRMKGPTTPPLKLKAVLISDDGGQTWIVMKQYYLVDLRSDSFISTFLQGRKFRLEDQTCPPKN